MKREIIIFQNKDPKTRKEVCNHIAHFCSDHCFQYEFTNSTWPICFSIDGEPYEAEVKVEFQEQKPYWMIWCRQTGAAAAI